MAAIRNFSKKIWLLFLFFIACSSEPRIELIDQLIQKGEYQKARQVITEEMQKVWSDTLQYRRLKYRLIKIQKHEFFSPIDSLIAQSPQKALILLNNLEDSLKQMDPKRAKYFYFDLYYRTAAAYDQVKADSLWLRETYKALNYFTDQYELKRRLYERVAFYLASRGKYDQGLKMLDSSFRATRLSQLPKKLKEAYLAYLNGNFQKALTLLELMPEEEKNKHWKNLQKFLKNYGDKLSINERFKLW